MPYFGVVRLARTIMVCFSRTANVPLSQASALEHLLCHRTLNDGFTKDHWDGASVETHVAPIGITSGACTFSGKKSSRVLPLLNRNFHAIYVSYHRAFTIMELLTALPRNHVLYCNVDNILPSHIIPKNGKVAPSIAVCDSVLTCFVKL